MDISRQLPAEVSSLAGESEAVAILHRTLVNLREELIKRDNRIQQLESKISNENLTQKGCIILPKQKLGFLSKSKFYSDYSRSAELFYRSFFPTDFKEINEDPV